MKKTYFHNYRNHEYYKNITFHSLTIDIVYNRAERNTIFWYTKTLSNEYSELAYLSQPVSSITILLQVTTAHDDTTTSVFLLSR